MKQSTDEKIKVLLVEDHAMFRERLALLISQDFGMTICGETDNIRQALEIVRTAKPTSSSSTLPSRDRAAWSF